MADEIGQHGSPGVLLELLRSPSMWGIMIAQASGIYTLYLLLFWMPSYLQDTKHLTIMKTGLYTAIPWAVAVPVSILIGLASDRLLKGNSLLAGGRRGMVIFAFLLAAACALVPFTDNTTLIIVLFAVSLSGMNAAISLNGNAGYRPRASRPRRRQGNQPLHLQRQHLRSAGADHHRLHRRRPWQL